MSREGVNIGQKLHQALSMSLKAVKLHGAALLLATFAALAHPPAAAALHRLQVGMDAPNFSLKTLGGELKEFSDLKGEKLTALVFWATWSKKSEPLLATMKKLHEQYGDKGLSVIAVNADDQNLSEQHVAAAKELVGKIGLSFPVLLDHGLVAFNDYGVIALPTTVIMDSSRTVKYELSGYPLEGASDMADFLAEALEGKKRVAAAATPGHKPMNTAVRAFNMGNNSLKSRRMADSAELWFKKAIEHDPKFVLPQIALGKFYSQRGKVAQARLQFESALSHESGNVIALCELGLVAANEGKTEEARALLDKALKQSDSYAECYTYSGIVYGKLGQIDKALHLFAEAATINPKDYKSFNFKAKMLEENKKPQDAVDAYRQAVERILGVN